MTVPRSRLYIGALAQRMRAAMAEADKASAEWKGWKEAFEVKFATEQKLRKKRGQVPLTALEKAAKMAENAVLSDAFADQGWWRTQAAVLAAVLQAEIALADYEERRR